MIAITPATIVLQGSKRLRASPEEVLLTSERTVSGKRGSESIVTWTVEVRADEAPPHSCKICCARLQHGRIDAVAAADGAREGSDGRSVAAVSGTALTLQPPGLAALRRVVHGAVVALEVHSKFCYLTERLGISSSDGCLPFLGERERRVQAKVATGSGREDSPALGVNRRFRCDFVFRVN
ncbi:hypothetical protein Aduo_005408 [Ancylostoma duodenale]